MPTKSFNKKAQKPQEETINVYYSTSGNEVTLTWLLNIACY
jgi:hypothetical protein